ncbi:hypothetical protein [Streptomyces sp. NPDC057199]|uniref:hypothetical protein n=1 Tax=Streptomyces sp. NPDC057199 TaxID=3346047 RepID=UPI00362FD271
MTARWKSLAPQERLRRRGELLKVADFLATAATALKLARDSDLARDRRRRPGLDPDLARAYRVLRGDPDPDRAFALDLARALTHAPGTRHTIYVAIRDPDPELRADRILAGARDRASNFERDPTRARARALALAEALGRDLDRDRAVDLAFSFDRVSDTSELHQDCIQAQRNLADAASNFVGADLSTVNPAEVNLAGIRWDSDTQWPTAEWTARIRRASVEDPPGSGVFIVRPEEGHNFADRASLAPTS